MRILFVWPNPPGAGFEYYPGKNQISELMAKISPLVKPLAFPILAALTPEKHTVDLIEGRPQDINYNEKYDLVAITSTTRYVNWTYEIADEFRRRGVKVVLGGWHPSAMPEEAKQHADAVVIGEAEETWPELLNDLEKGKTKSFYIPNKPVDTSLIPRPSYKLYPKGTSFTIMATRGCPNGCNFCSITNMKYGNILRKRPIEEVIKDIKDRPNKIFNMAVEKY